MLRAPPATKIGLVASAYGRASFGPFTTPRCRAWIVYDPDGDVTEPRLQIAVNRSDAQPTHPAVEIFNDDPGANARGARWYDLGIVAHAEISPKSWSVRLKDDSTPLTMVSAPCACGAGSVGLAGPSPHRHVAHWTRVPEDASWITRTRR